MTTDTKLSPHAAKKQLKAATQPSLCAALFGVFCFLAFAAALVSSVGRCAFMHCTHISRGDALIGFVLAAMPYPLAHVKRGDWELPQFRRGYDASMWAFARPWLLNLPAFGSTAELFHAPGTAENGHYAVPVYVVQPVSAATLPQSGRPLLLYFHGGGMVRGCVARRCEHTNARSPIRQVFGQANDPVAHTFAHYAADSVVVSVEYRLAPEHEHPLGVEDAYAALVWAVANAETLGADAHRVGLCGISAGGLVSAAVALLARDRGAPSIKAQLLGMRAFFFGLNDKKGCG